MVIRRTIAALFMAFSMFGVVLVADVPGITAPVADAHHCTTYYNQFGSYQVCTTNPPPVPLPPNNAPGCVFCGGSGAWWDAYVNNVNYGWNCGGYC